MPIQLRFLTDLIRKGAILLLPEVIWWLVFISSKTPVNVKFWLLLTSTFLNSRILNDLSVLFFRRWSTRSKKYLNHCYFTLGLFNVWLTYRFIDSFNDFCSHIDQEDGTSVLAAFILLGVSLVLYVLDQYEDYKFIKKNHPSAFIKEINASISQGDELHLTSDLQTRIFLFEDNKGPIRIIVVAVKGEPVSGYETPIIESDKPFVPNRELRHDTAQTKDLFGLQEDLLPEIFKKLPAFHDFASCSTVCKLWRSHWLNLQWSLYPPHPWSIHFQGQNIMNHLDDGKYVLERWEIDGRYYYGSINGWILSIGSKHLFIFNLFSRTQRNLPMLSPVNYLPITKPIDWYNYVEKFILFKVGEGDYFEFLAVALFGPRGFIAFTRPSVFQDWIYIQNVMAPFKDVVLFRGRFYALCGRGKLVHCAFDRSKPSESLVSQEPAGSFRADRYYLVKNVDHLLAVFQYGNVDSGGKRFDTMNFRIYRSDDIMNWTHIREPIYLEGRALFISNRNSWTIDPAEMESCRTNSIYFVDDYWFSNNRDGHFIGLFDITKGHIEDLQFEKDQYPLINDLSPYSLTVNDGA